MDKALIEDLESRGCLVITGHRFVVQDKGEVETGKVDPGTLKSIRARKVSGLDISGRPMEMNPTTCMVIGPEIPCKIYYGNTIKVVEQKIQNKVPDYEKGEIDDTENLFDAVARAHDRVRT